MNELKHSEDWRMDERGRCGWREEQTAGTRPPVMDGDDDDDEESLSFAGMWTLNA